MFKQVIYLSKENFDKKLSAILPFTMPFPLENHQHYFLADLCVKIPLN